MNDVVFQVDHISYSVRDIALSIAFYKVLGFNEIKEWQSKDLLLKMSLLKNKENIIIELVSCANSVSLPNYAKDYKDSLRHIGIRHLALKVESVEEAHVFVSSKGVRNISSIQTGKLGRPYFFVNDPDGNVLEFIQGNI
jgi:catechol 2,3-dioxygenase-like lactoylglutathione lyase family enzyme